MSVTDPILRVLYGRLARFEIGPQQTLTAGLNRLPVPVQRGPGLCRGLGR